MADTNPKRNPKNMMNTQQMAHLPTGSVDKLVECIKQTLKPKKYAVILHDKDTHKDGSPVESHVHAMLCFNKARSEKHVAELLGDKSQYVQRWTGNSQNGFAYLVHATAGDRDKHQYSPDEVIANFDYAAELATITAEVKQAKDKKYNKALACDTIIITTPYNPATFYWAAFDGKMNNLATRIDSFDQLRRRISLTICMDNENIQAVEYDTGTRTYVPMSNACRPNPYSQTHRPAPTADAAALYNSMFT